MLARALVHVVVFAAAVAARRPKAPLWSAALLCAAALALAPPARADDAVLDRFVGTWRTEMRISDTTQRGEAVGRRVLAGAYVEVRTRAVPAGAEELQLMTWDAAAGLYRQWVFDSEGYRHSADGRWDATTSTLRWEGTRDGARFVIDDHFATPDRLDWTLRRADAAGALVPRVTGTLLRSKP